MDEWICRYPAGYRVFRIENSRYSLLRTGVLFMSKETMKGLSIKHEDKVAWGLFVGFTKG